MDFLFGEEPESTVTSTSTLTPEQNSLLKAIIAQLQGAEGVGGLKSDFGLGATPLEASTLASLEQLSTALPQGGGTGGQAAGSAATAATQSLEELFKSGPQDIDAYFRAAVQDPLLEQFSEDILPAIQTKHSSQFFGGERREAEGRARGDLLDTLARERTKVGFEEFNKNITNKIAGASVLPAVGEFATSQPFLETNNRLNQLLALFGAGRESAGIKQRQLDERNRRVREILASIGLPAIEVVGQTTGGSSGILPSIIGAGGQLGAASIMSGTPIFSSKEFKEELGPVETILDGVEKLPIKAWRYKKKMGLGTDKHVGPYAEDFEEIFGLGDGRVINPVDLHGVSLAATKELASRVRAIEASFVMAIVLNTPRDTRFQELGESIERAVSSIAKARLLKAEEDKKKKALREALDIFSAAIGGEDIEEPVSEETRNKEALKAGGGPTKKAAAIKEQLPTTTKRKPKGSDVAARMIDAGVDEKFAITLAASVEESRKGREDEARKSAALSDAINIAAEEGASRKDVLTAIGSAEVDTGTKLSMIQQLDNLIPKTDADEEFVIDVFDEGGETLKIPVSKAVAKNLETRQTFLDKNFPGFSASPVKKPLSERPETAKVTALDDLVDRGLITQDTRDKQIAGLLEVRGPDTEGRVSIIDKGTNAVRFIGGGNLTAASLTRLEDDIRGVTQAIQLLRRTDPSQAGILNILESTVGGVALQVPVVSSIARAFGLSEEEVAQAQASRAGFYATLGPLIESFSPGGSRRSIASPTAIALSKRLLQMTNWSSTPGGGQLAKDQLLNILEDVNAQMIAQRISRSAIPPVMEDVSWRTDEEGNLVFSLGKPKRPDGKPITTPTPTTLPPVQGEKRSEAPSGGAKDFETLASALTMVESGGDDNRIGQAGETGRFQVLPSTAKDPGFGVRPAKDNSVQEANRVGRDYLAALLEHYGNEDQALAAYNWGPDKVDKWIKKGGKVKDLPKDVRRYIRRVQVERELLD